MQSGKVLVVDDEELVGLALAEMVKFLGYEPTVCTTADQALNLVKVHPFDLVFTDIRMPGMDGVAFYRFLSIVNEPLARRLIFVTGDLGNPETREMVRRTSAVCLEKPVHFDELEKAIAKTLAEACWKKNPSTARPPGQKGASQNAASESQNQSAPLDPRAALDRAEKEWAQAILKGDTEALARLLTDDFVATHQAATVWFKPDYLAALKKRAHPPASISSDDVHVRIHGNCGVVSALVSVDGGDGQHQAEYRVTRTWIYQSGQWRCLANHASVVKMSISLKNACPFDAEFPQINIRCD